MRSILVRAGVLGLVAGIIGIVIALCNSPLGAPALLIASSIVAGCCLIALAIIHMREKKREE